MDDQGLGKVMRHESGVVSRAQVLAAGGSDADIARNLRRRLWKRVHSGVFVDHTGPLSWPQRAWAAVLVAHPAALAGASALRAHGVRGHEQQGVVDVVVAEHRRVRPPHGVRVRRTTAFETRVQANLSPPSTPARLYRALLASPTLPRRALLLEILGDVASGTYSALGAFPAPGA